MKRDKTEDIEFAMLHTVPKTCGYCGRDYGCDCRRKLEDQDWKNRFYALSWWKKKNEGR